MSDSVRVIAGSVKVETDLPVYNSKWVSTIPEVNSFS
jgi:hypothetical protein